jgi:hypothetical protein
MEEFIYLLKAFKEVRVNKNGDKLDFIKKVNIKEQLEEKINSISLIKGPVLDKSSSVSIFEYGDLELKTITDVINEISYYATDNVVSGDVLVECINGVIPKLTIFDRLNSVTISEKIGNRIYDTKINFNTVEDNLKTQILVYEYLIKAYDLKIKLINFLKNNIDSALVEDNGGLINMALEKRKENLDFGECSTDTMINQIKILAVNHLNVLNMLYRTKETFLTVIEGQTLINSSIQAEKAALKNIKNIVNVYESALNNDFVSAFELINKLKSSGLDQNSANQLETNISNIQVLFSPSVMDEVNEIKPSTSNIEIETDENLNLPVGHVRD